MHNKSGINFIAIDFETAAAKHASICEADICVIQHGEIAVPCSWLVRPEDNRYQYWNIKVHHSILNMIHWIIVVSNWVLSKYAPPYR